MAGNKTSKNKAEILLQEARKNYHMEEQALAEETEKNAVKATEAVLLFSVIRGKKIELAVILAAFYGLRRSEIVGLKWSAVDLTNRTLQSNIRLHLATSMGSTLKSRRIEQRTKPVVEPYRW
ncbi:MULTISPECIES: hypothetical protein [unclassified Paenibacillus]|uniref:hypothetical protein n=1 Tax=unclassified Paenibacillus TaxID=185978 RepID=UPI0024BA1D04|nr:MULTISPECIES: hypothetical protein [unclassified Paenibacillus]